MHERTLLTRLIPLLVASSLALPLFAAQELRQEALPPVTLRDIAEVPLLPQTVPPATRPPAVAASFASWSSRVYSPADAAGAVSATHVVGITNHGLAVHDRAGRTLARVTLEEFWSDPTDHFDPRIVYDTRYDRWVITSLNESSGTIWMRVAISQSRDPLGAWNRVRFDVRPDADFMRIAITRDYVIAQTNNGSRSRFVLLPRDQIYITPPGVTLPSAGFTMPGENVAPVTSDSSVGNPYLARFDGQFLQLWELVIPPQGTVRTVGTYRAPFASPEFLGDIAPLPGFAPPIDAGYTDVGAAMIRNGVVYVVHTVFDQNQSPRATAVMLWRITTGGTLIGSTLIGDPARREWYAFPAVAVNQNGAMVIAYSVFAATRFPSSAYTYIGTLNDQHAPVTLKEGEGIPTSRRWGDYNTVVTDPVNDVDFWVTTCYAGNGVAWATWWTKLEMPVSRRRAASH